jgi:hypothetical protein
MSEILIDRTGRFEVVAASDGSLTVTVSTLQAAYRLARENNGARGVTG